LVANSKVGVISFTGSTAVGREIAEIGGRRLARVSLELGGKNPLIVCDDADLDHAAKWVLLSGFSNAGQRCASGSRIIVFDSVYGQFRELLVQKTKELKVGPSDQDDLGPVINQRQLDNMLSMVQSAQEAGGKVLIGGDRLSDPQHHGGFYMAPTILEKVPTDHPIHRSELFGPIVCLYRASGYDNAIAIANDSPYGLTACIHTNNFDRAMNFVQRSQTGVVVVNAGTYGSEPHMPFGGYKDSGNGTREPGTEALDVYSELKDVYLQMRDE
jgi:acyl-CoA reductase-like NAD-dependent aldehyde dehydrogenase